MSKDAKKIQRKKLHDSIQAWGREEEDLSEALLVGWVLLAEWVQGDGRCLSRLGGTEDRDIPSWQKSGYLFEGLFGDFWDVDLNNDDEDDEDTDA